MNEIVKYDNSFNNLSLKKFTSTELDLLMCLCSKMREKDTKEIVFTFEQLKSLSKYSATANKKFIKDLKSTNEKLMQLHFEIKTENMIYQFVLFPTFGINTENLTLTVGVNERFKFILNDLTSNFTRFELQEFVNLKSEYSKKLYRMLKQYKSSGWWKVSIEEFNRILDIPTSYTNMKIGAKILNPCIEELSKYFTNLKCIKIRANKRGKPIIAYEFTFGDKTNSNSSANSKHPDNDILGEGKVQPINEPKDKRYGGLLDELDLTETEIQRVYRAINLKFNTTVNTHLEEFELLDHCIETIKLSKKPINFKCAYLISMIENENI